MRNILEKVGVYITSYSKVNKFIISRDEIITRSAGIIKVLNKTVSFENNGRLCVVTIIAIADIESYLKDFIDKSKQSALRTSSNLSPILDNTKFNRFLEGYTYYIDKKITNPEILNQLNRAITIINNEKDYEFAIEVLNSILNRDSRISEAWAMLAICHGKIAYNLIGKDKFKSGKNFEEEKRIWERAITIEQRNATFQYYAGLAYFNHDMTSYGRLPYKERILKYFRKAVGLFPHYIKARILIGDIYLACSEYEEALRQYNKILVDYPENEDVLAKKAEVRDKLQQ